MQAYPRITEWTVVFQLKQEKGLHQTLLTAEAEISESTSK
jgi:hypothetical protein